MMVVVTYLTRTLGTATEYRKWTFQCLGKKSFNATRSDYAICESEYGNNR